MINKPAIVKSRCTFVTEVETPLGRQYATAACEVVAINVTAGNSAATFRIVDTSNYLAGYGLEDGISVAVEASNSQDFCPSQPIPFRRGMAIVCEQGEGSNAECTVLLN